MRSSASPGATTASLRDRRLRHRLRVRVATGHGSSFTVNLGDGGYCVEQMRVPPVGTRIEGHVSLDGREVPFSGQVVWAAPGEPRLNQRGRMGVRFVRVGPALGASLERRTSVRAGAAAAGPAIPT